jgi:hypothetical protein
LTVLYIKDHFFENLSPWVGHSLRTSMRISIILGSTFLNLKPFMSLMV